MLVYVNTKVLLIFQTKISAKYTKLGEMDLNARVDVIDFRVDVNFQTVTVTLIRYVFFLHFDIIQH